MSKALWAAILLYSISPQAMAEDCSCAVSASERQSMTLLEEGSASGKQVQILLAGNPVPRSTRVATICSNVPATVAEVVLWMPDMGHGSSPTKPNTVTATCTKVERVNFVMQGPWDVRVRFADGDSVTFSTDVVP